MTNKMYSNGKQSMQYFLLYPNMVLEHPTKQWINKQISPSSTKALLNEVRHFLADQFIVR